MNLTGADLTSNPSEACYVGISPPLYGIYFGNYSAEESAISLSNTSMVRL